MRSGRLDRKVEFPHPNEDARAKILQIHSRKMNRAWVLLCFGVCTSMSLFMYHSLYRVKLAWLLQDALVGSAGLPAYTYPSAQAGCQL